MKRNKSVREIANILNSYALFKAKDKKLLDDDDLAARLKSADKINSECVTPHRATQEQSNSITDLNSKKS